ncbi:MBL fold metallo-hydrolase [Phototrophicus methaneseepsis]|uniref:MBL fold metallo-hydrolase n=1 Tax=Phototrophicus methaneseepsis TaxID=2710758 RepID=A0A7S8EAM2_9CHLR|nr:MBL fold metallo-hydrolase [Phototrophicus methaneseepsis]QPC83426.1 MBL fold metallo-hydrolase [Phototrophicus methaneseepsis]
MDITWYGHSCFRITERGQTTVVTDPYHADIGLSELKIKGDVVTISHDDLGHNAVDLVKGQQYSLRGPGEYEIGGVFIRGIAMHTVTNDIVSPNVAYMIEYDNNLTVLHLGGLKHVPDQSTIEELGEVTVLLLPVGGGSGLRPTEAADVIAVIEPSYVVPMHYAQPGLKFDLEPVDKFLKAVGVSKAVEEDMLRVTAGTLPEQPQVVLLTPAQE